MLCFEIWVIFFTFFSPALSTEYTLQWADVNMGEKEFKNNVQLSCIDDNLYKITSSEGEETFRMWDFTSMIGAMVEFDTYNSNPHIRCKFESLTMAKRFYRTLKPVIHPEVEFPIISLAIVLDQSHFIILAEGKVAVEMRNRFYIRSRISNSVMMIFSGGLFNVSPVFAGGCILLVVQLYEPEAQIIIMMRFVLTFTDDTVAQRFHDYVKRETPCTNDVISVNIPDHLTLGI